MVKLEGLAPHGRWSSLEPGTIQAASLFNANCAIDMLHAFFVGQEVYRRVEDHMLTLYKSRAKISQTLSEHIAERLPQWVLDDFVDPAAADGPQLRGGFAASGARTKPRFPRPGAVGGRSPEGSPDSQNEGCALGGCSQPNSTTGSPPPAVVSLGSESDYGEKETVRSSVQAAAIGGGASTTEASSINEEQANGKNHPGKWAWKSWNERQAALTKREAEVPRTLQMPLAEGSAAGSRRQDELCNEVAEAEAILASGRAKGLQPPEAAEMGRGKRRVPGGF